MAFKLLLKSPLYDSSIKFQIAKEFAVHIERGASWNDEESLCCIIVLLDFILDTPSLERVELCGVPAMALSNSLRSFIKIRTW